MIKVHATESFVFLYILSYCCRFSIYIAASGYRLKIVNVYGPPDRDDPSFFQGVFDMAVADQQDHMIFCGDWNLALNPRIDTFNYKSRDRRAKSRDLIESKCKDLGLHDAWRLFNGEKAQYTWRKSNPLKCARLDFFLVTDSLLNKAMACEILPAYRTDHSRVSLKLKLSSQTRGRGFWKLNFSFLKDINYVQKVKSVIQETLRTYACKIYSDEYVSNPEARQCMQLIGGPRGGGHGGHGPPLWSRKVGPYCLLAPLFV